IRKSLSCRVFGRNYYGRLYRITPIKILEWKSFFIMVKFDVNLYSFTIRSILQLCSLVFSS
ncbi:MAG: hypothetical protein IJY54_02115, partial [Paludibacteraceae bacterium]|nr:hypothetical protein [Paludibacteraceae bacterium]